MVVLILKHKATTVKWQIDGSICIYWAWYSVVCHDLNSLIDNLTALPQCHYVIRSRTVLICIKSIRKIILLGDLVMDNNTNLTLHPAKGLLPSVSDTVFCIFGIQNPHEFPYLGFFFSWKKSPILCLYLCLIIINWIYSQVIVALVIQEWYLDYSQEPIPLFYPWAWNHPWGFWTFGWKTKVAVQYM